MAEGFRKPSLLIRYLPERLVFLTGPSARSSGQQLLSMAAGRPDRSAPNPLEGHSKYEWKQNLNKGTYGFVQVCKRPCVGLGICQYESFCAAAFLQWRGDLHLTPLGRLKGTSLVLVCNCSSLEIVKVAKR